VADVLSTTEASDTCMYRFILIIRVIEEHVIYPRLMEYGIHLHPLVVIVAVLAWRHGLRWLDERQGFFRL